MAANPKPRSFRRGRARRAGNAEPEQAARQRAIDRQLRVWTPRRILGWVLVGIAVLVAVVHWVAHLGYPILPWSLGWQDVLVGYPAAALFGVVAAIILGQVPQPSAGGGPRSPRR
jgi:di/tricarboxylate transporter